MPRKTILTNCTLSADVGVKMKPTAETREGSEKIKSSNEPVQLGHIFGLENLEGRRRNLEPRS